MCDLEMKVSVPKDIFKVTHARSQLVCTELSNV